MNGVEGSVLVLEEYIGYEDFLRVATEKGWIKYKTYEGDGETTTFEEVWTTTERDSAIHYIKDHVVITEFIWIRGTKVEELQFEIARRLPSYPDDELIEMAVNAEDHDAAVDAIFKIAVGFPRFDANAMQVFEVYLTSSDTILRKATVQAIAYRLWTESLPLLEKVAQEDSDSDVRQFAQTILNQAQNQRE